MNIETQDGFYEFDNGIIKLFFLQEDQYKYARALKQGVLALIRCSCLGLDQNGICTKSNWSNVRNKMQLANQVKRMRLEKPDVD